MLSKLCIGSINIGMWV